MKHAYFTNPTCKGVSFAALLAASSLTSVAAAADAPANSQNGAASRDRHDTVYSHESRLNTSTHDTDVAGAKVSRGDRRFIEKAARNGMAEVRVARLAAERSTDPRVRSFAQQLVTDHEKTNAELSELAARKGVSLAMEDTGGDHHLKGLSDKNGVEFDKRFIGHMADEHEDDIELFEKASRKSDDTEIAAFASKQLPALQEHRRMAQDIEKSLKG